MPSTTRAPGVPVTKNQVSYTAKFQDELAGQPGFARAYLTDGKPHPAGTLQRFTALATTLERLAGAGLGDFYRGEIGAALAAELARLDSPVRAGDLRAHHAQVVRPLSVKVGAGELFNMTPPTQGLASLMILALFDRVRGDAKVDSFEHVHNLVEATKQAFLVRNRHICDPDAMTVEAASFLAEASLRERAAAIDPRRARPWPEPAIKGDTVWMGACDGEGRMVSYIQSVYWEFGSGVVLADTGVGWQNRGSSFLLDPASHLALAPGRKPFHTLNPALAQARRRPHHGLRQHGRRRPAAEPGRGVQPLRDVRRRPAAGGDEAALAAGPHLGHDERQPQGGVAPGRGGHREAARGAATTSR